MKAYTYTPCFLTAVQVNRRHYARMSEMCPRDEKLTYQYRQVVRGLPDLT